MAYKGTPYKIYEPNCLSHEYHYHQRPTTHYQPSCIDNVFQKQGRPKSLLSQPQKKLDSLRKMPYIGISSRETQLGGPLVCRVEHYNLTLIVTRQDRYFCLSPMSMTLLRKGTAALMRSSMGTGAMFSPPDVMMSSTGPYS